MQDGSPTEKPRKKRGKFSFTYADGGFKLAIEGRITTELIRLGLATLTTTAGFLAGASTFPQEARSDYQPPAQVEQHQLNDRVAPALPPGSTQEGSSPQQ